MQPSLGTFNELNLTKIFCKRLSIIVNVMAQKGSRSKTHADGKCSLSFHLLLPLPTALKHAKIRMNCTLWLNALILAYWKVNKMTRNGKSFSILPRQCCKPQSNMMRQNKQKKRQNVGEKVWNIQTGLSLSQKHTHLETETEKPVSNFHQTSFSLACVFTCVLRWLRPSQIPIKMQMQHL